MSKVIYKVINQIGYITVNRPDVLNCFDYETLCELQEVIDAVYYDGDIRVVIFTGAGEKAFSAGADLKERKSLNDTEVRRNVKAIRDVFNSIAGLPQPTMAAVNGYALGEDLNGCFHVTLQLLRKVFLWGSLKLAGPLFREQAGHSGCRD